MKQSGKIPVAIPRFILRKKNPPSFDSPWFGLSYGAFAIVYSSLVNLLCLIHRDSRNLRELTQRIGKLIMVDSPRFPKSSGIGPKKTMEKMKELPTQ